MEEDPGDLRRIKQKVASREETRQWIQRKKQERYEAQLMELEAKKQEEERKKQHKAEFEKTMKHLKMKAITHKPSTQRPPSLMSKMQRGPHVVALVKNSITTKVVQSSENISPKPRPFKQISNHSNARRSSSEPLRSPSKASVNSQQSSMRPFKEISDLPKENSPQSSIMNVSQLMDSKASSDKWLLESDAMKISPAKSMKNSPRSNKAMDRPSRQKSDGLFSSRTEKQRILESCKSNVMKPVIDPPMKAVAPPSDAKPRPSLNISDLGEGGGDEKEAPKRKTDQEYGTDCKKSRQDSHGRSVLVSSSSSHPHSKYYHFSYVEPPSPSPSPLNVSFCSEFNETSSSRALAQFNSKVQMLKRALSTEFTPDTFVGTLEKSLKKDAVSSLNNLPGPSSRSQESATSVQNSSQKNKSTRNRVSQTQKIRQPTSCKDLNSEGLTCQPPNSERPSRIEMKENLEDSGASSSFEIGFRDPTPFNFTSTTKARLNRLTNETQREPCARKRQTVETTQRQETRKKQKGESGDKEDISDQIAQEVANCQRNVAQLKACSGPRKVGTSTNQLAASVDHSSATHLSHLDKRDETKVSQDCHVSGNPPDSFNTFTLAQSTSLFPVNRTFDRSVKPLPLSVEDLKLQFPHSSQSTSSSCIDFSEVRLLHQHNQCVLSTSQIPERDSGETDDTLVDDSNDNRVNRTFDKRNSSDLADPRKDYVERNTSRPADHSKVEASKHNNYGTYKVARNISAPSSDFHPSTNILDKHHIVPQEARKKSAFYSVPPSLTRPDYTLCSKGKQGTDVNFRRISSTPTSSLKSVETFKDSDTLSDIPPSELVQPGVTRQDKKHNQTSPPRKATVMSSATNTAPADRCTKSVATQSSLPCAALCDPLPSCTSDTICDPLTELSLTREAHNKDESIFTIKNWNSPKFSLELLNKMIKAEEERQKQGKIILKLQSKAVTDKVMAELARLETEKKTLKECGGAPHSSDQLRNLKKRQRGLLMRLNQERGHLNATAKQLLSQSQERIQQLTCQYNLLRTQLDTKAVLKVIDDSFRFHDDFADSDVTSAEAMPLDIEVPNNVRKLKAFSSLPEGLDRGDMSFTKALHHGKLVKPASQQKILKDQSTSPLGFVPHEAPAPPPSAPPTAIPMRAALYPKYLRRLSSGSEDSFIYSHNETISDQSDLELRIRSLQDQLSKRKQESERLKRELRSVRAENLKAKEASLLQQIRFYDKHIKLSAQELENEKENLNRPGQVMMKPMILKPTKKMTPKTLSNMSSLEEASDHTLSSCDYLKESFETDTTNIMSKESIMNQCIVQKISDQETRAAMAKESLPSNKNNLVNKAIELPGNSTLTMDAVKITQSSLKSSKTIESDSKATEVVDTFDVHTVEGEAVIEDLNEVMSSSKDDVIQELQRLSSRHSESASEILTELEGSRDDIVEEILSTEQSNVESIVSEKIEEVISSVQSLGETVDSEIIEEVISTKGSNVESFRSEDVEEVLSSDDNKLESLISENIEEVLSTEQSKAESEASENIEVLSTERNKVESLMSEKYHGNEIDTKRTASSENTKASEDTRDSVEAKTENSEMFGEKNVESEVMQVSFREKTVNETFIVHEESLSFRGDNSVHSGKQEKEMSESVDDIIEELSEVSTGSRKEEYTPDQSPALKELILSPPERIERSPIEEITTQHPEDSNTSGQSVTDKDFLEADGENEETKHSPNDSRHAAFIEDTQESKQDVVETSLNASDILSPNISDLQDYLALDKDFLSNYSLIHLSPSKAPETPFLHALNRDYQMSRKLQLEQITNEVLTEELNASIESIMSLYNTGRKNEKASEEMNANIASIVSLYNKDCRNGRVDRVREETIEDVEEDVENDEVDDSLNGKIDFLSLNLQHQKELSWTDEDDYLLEVAPPSVVAEVLLQKERQIDEEIEKIKQLTSHIPDPSTRRKLYPYLREIPDKPPPPYIEPASSVPSSEEEIKGIVEAMVDKLRHKDKEVPSSNIARIQMYYSFLCDLTRDVYTSITTPSTDVADPALPWLQPRVKAKLSKKKISIDPQEISARVVSEVSELLSLRPSCKSDSFLLRWSRPKRDPVDEIIVQESKSEEAMWTEYQTEEMEIKNEITEIILDELIGDTVGVFQRLLS